MALSYLSAPKDHQRMASVFRFVSAFCYKAHLEDHLSENEIETLWQGAAQQVRTDDWLLSRAKASRSPQDASDSSGREVFGWMPPIAPGPFTLAESKTTGSPYTYFLDVLYPCDFDVPDPPLKRETGPALEGKGRFKLPNL
jgi:hypothetical protein